MRPFVYLSTLFILFPLLFAACHKDKLKCENELILQPGPNFGKDAYIHESFKDNNAGHSPENLVLAWTFRAIGGEPGACRSLLQFDLTAVPKDAQITEATLALYHAEGTKNSRGGHSTEAGSNEANIYLLTEPWQEYTVTWNNAPAYDPSIKLYIPKSTFQEEDYEDIDLLAFVKKWHAAPEENHGMLIRLITETYYRGLNFASSDHQNAEIHPKLTIKFKR